MFFHCMYMPPIIFPPVVGGQLVYFPLLIITSSASVNICVHVVIRVAVFISEGYMSLGVKLRGHLVVLCLTF